MRGLASCMLALLALCSLSPSARAQTLTKVVRLEVDENEWTKDYKVFLICKDIEFEARQEGEGFVVPPEVRRCEQVSVRVLFGGYDLTFGSIHVSKFEADWVVGVDNRPYSEENLREDEDPAQIKFIYYISFQSKRGLDTQLTVKIK